MVMAQVLLKAEITKWGKEAEESVGKEMKQLHWLNSFKPMCWVETYIIWREPKKNF